MSRTLDHLLDRNVEWVAGKTRDDPLYFHRMAEQQTPEYLWIGCSDSRVTANDVLDLDPGAVFVHRNVANIVHTSDMNILSVIEFAVEHLKVEHIIVCGHYGCGGVTRAISGASGALVDHWLQPISMLHRKHKPRFDAITDTKARLDRMCEINIEMQVIPSFVRHDIRELGHDPVGHDQVRHDPVAPGGALFPGGCSMKPRQGIGRARRCQL